MKNTIKFIGIIALAAVIGFSMASCGDNGGGFNDVRITITGIPSTHWDPEDSNQYLRGVMMMLTNEDGESVATGFAEISGGGSASVPLVDGGTAWNGRGRHHIELNFSYLGGDYFFTNGQDFDVILPPAFDQHTDDMEDYLQPFNITSGRHTINLNQFRHSSTIP